jgi:hypothetical protein
MSCVERRWTVSDRLRLARSLTLGEHMVVTEEVAESF